MRRLNIIEKKKNSIIYEKEKNSKNGREAFNKINLISNEYIGESCIKVKHKSGLTIYISKKPFSSAYAIFGTRYGSYDNVFKLSTDKEFSVVPEGIAHFLEHKMFESDDGHDTFEDFAEIGADANAYTSTDRTAYLFSCTDNFYRALEVLLRMVTTPVFTKENVLKEQGIIGQEIKMVLDRPSNALYYNLMAAMYKENPVKIQIAGSLESIAKITPELLYKCYDVFYGMSNMALCIAGNVDENKIIEIADKILPIKDSSEIISGKINEGPECSEKVIKVYMEVAKPLFRIGIKDIYGKPEERTAMEILTEALFGQSSDFFTDLYERELVSSYSAYTEYSRPACYTALGGESDCPEEVFENFCRYAEKMVKKGVPKEDFERAKRVLYAEVMKEFDTSESISEGFFDAFLVHGNFLTQAEEYSSVRYEEVNDLAKRILKKEHFALSTVCPNKEKK